MTLRQLADRLNEIIAENDRRGWSDRNDLPVGVCVNRRGKHRVRNHYYTKVKYVEGSKFGIGDLAFCGMINVDESDLLK